ncbi:MAG TPA: hypothetical protein PKA41_11015 [Verrucomicrobiota bacterium]|nr:hypothetical protein [Verrucomicrobiota bacterium]
MKTIVSWLLESLAATLIIIVCLSAPQMLKLPPWTMGLFAFPMIIYLSWRLRPGAIGWGRALLATVAITGLIFIQEKFVTEDWQVLFSFGIAVVIWMILRSSNCRRGQ